MNTTITNTIRKYFKDKPVDRAWIFGSFSRNEEQKDSDVDIIVQFSNDAKISLLDHAIMTTDLQGLLHRNVDLVKDGTLLPFAIASADNDKILIYERNN